MMEPTYGKWKWYWKENESYEADCGVYVEEVYGQAVSVCRAPRFEKKERWEANACLIAHAPDYHEHAYNLAMLILQSNLYQNPEVKLEVDNVLAIHAKVKGRKS